MQIVFGGQLVIFFTRWPGMEMTSPLFCKHQQGKQFSPGGKIGFGSFESDKMRGIADMRAQLSLRAHSHTFEFGYPFKSCH